MSYFGERFRESIPKHLTKYLKNNFLKHTGKMHAIILRRKRVHQQNIKPADKIRYKKNIKEKKKHTQHQSYKSIRCQQ